MQYEMDELYIVYRYMCTYMYTQNSQCYLQSGTWTSRTRLQVEGEPIHKTRADGILLFTVWYLNYSYSATGRKSTPTHKTRSNGPILDVLRHGVLELVAGGEGGGGVGEHAEHVPLGRAHVLNWNRPQHVNKKCAGYKNIFYSSEKGTEYRITRSKINKEILGGTLMGTLSQLLESSTNISSFLK